MLWSALLSCADSRRNMRPANGPSDKHCRKALPWQRYSRCACTTWRHTSALTTGIGGAPAPSWRHSDGNFAPLTRGKCTPSCAHSWRKRKSGSWTEPIPLWEASSNAGFCRTILTGWSRQAPQTGLLGMYDPTPGTHCPPTPPAAPGAWLGRPPGHASGGTDEWPPALRLPLCTAPASG